MEALNTFSLKGENIVLGYNTDFPITKTPFSFEFPNKSLIALIGCNGSGKTTLLRSFLGEPLLLNGTVILNNGKNLIEELLLKSGPSQISYVPQEHQFPPYLILNDLCCLFAGY